MQTNRCGSLAWHDLHSSLVSALASGVMFAQPCLVHPLPKPTHTLANVWSYLSLPAQYLDLNHVLTSGSYDSVGEFLKFPYLAYHYGSQYKEC